MSRKDIHYWKCDRPAAFHGTDPRREKSVEIEDQLSSALRHHFDTRAVKLIPGTGQGSHLTWQAQIDGVPMFLRVENGPEQDRHLAVESAILDRVRESGVRTPLVYGCDASRTHVPFAWQALELITDPDLNYWQKQNRLNNHEISFAIGAAVAKWQTVKLSGFGVPDENLRGYHNTYATYFQLNLERHLAFLVEKQFFGATEQQQTLTAIQKHSPLLEMEHTAASSTKIWRSGTSWELPIKSLHASILTTPLAAIPWTISHSSAVFTTPLFSLAPSTGIKPSFLSPTIIAAVSGYTFCET